MVRVGARGASGTGGFCDGTCAKNAPVPTQKTQLLQKTCLCFSLELPRLLLQLTRPPKSRLENSAVPRAPGPAHIARHRRRWTLHPSPPGALPFLLRLGCLTVQGGVLTQGDGRVLPHETGKSYQSYQLLPELPVHVESLFGSKPFESRTFFNRPRSQTKKLCGVRTRH